MLKLIKVTNKLMSKLLGCSPSTAHRELRQIKSELGLKRLTAHDVAQYYKFDEKEKDDFKIMLINS